MLGQVGCCADGRPKGHLQPRVSSVLPGVHRGAFLHAAPTAEPDLRGLGNRAVKKEVK